MQHVIPEFVERLVLKSRTETDARKKDSVIFVLISRTNFSRNFGVHPSDGTVEKLAGKDGLLRKTWSECWNLFTGPTDLLQWYFLAIHKRLS